MDPAEKELFCYGIIKLGEALTFCKNERDNTLAKTGIIEFAKLYVNARNHFIHHEFYHTHLGRYDVTQECIKNLPSIEKLEERVIKLQGCGLSKLYKPIRKGENDFPFEYTHFVVCLNLEFTALKQILEIPDVDKKLDSEIALKAGINNHIRNILAIMVDLKDVDLMNKNKGNVCVIQKKAVDMINQIFCKEFVDYFALFNNAKEYRNALCHLDEMLQKPYFNIKQMIEFARDLQKMEGLGYVVQLKKEFLKETQKESTKPEEQKKESTKRDAESLKAASSEKGESAKKVKEDPTKQEKEKEIPESLKSLSEYGDDESPPPSTGAPGMRGNT